MSNPLEKTRKPLPLVENGKELTDTDKNLPLSLFIFSRLPCQLVFNIGTAFVV